MSDTNTEQNPVVTTLQEASEGLLFISETDAPLVPFFWPDENDVDALTPERLRELANISSDAPIESVSLARFFRSATKKEDWHNAEESAAVGRFQRLVETIKSTLKKPVVFRVGKVNIAVYVVGGIEGGWAGLETRVVET